MDLVAEYARRTIVLADGALLLDGPTREVFSRPDVLARASITPPPVTRLALGLGISPAPVTVAEASRAILARMRG
jgi:energy-coupling factor transport system ATP-binding protein